MIEKLRALAQQLELRGDWDEAKICQDAADSLLKQKATADAYRFAIEHGATVTVNAERLAP